MGIRGLATFIARYSDKYLEDYELKDCYLVIDGNSFACQLYASSSKFNNAFGGDYDRYATSVIEFFDALRKCKVAPLVLFDGGYEKCKLKTTFARIRQKWAIAKEVSPMSPFRNSLFPCFLREVVKEVLREMRIPFAQCLFEADAEIAAIARHLNCPVLSYDSDFFVYDVLYIPFPTLYLFPYKDKSCQSTDVTYYLSCSLYRVENFLKRYGGLQKEILPFLSIMLGCDYIGNKVYKYFVSKLKRKTCRGSNQRQRRIASLLEWLRNETLESAKSKVLGCIRKHKREVLKNQIKKIISMYIQDSSELLPFLGFEACARETEFPDVEKHVIHVLEDQESNDDCQVGDLDSDTSDERNNATFSSKDISSESDGSVFSDEQDNEDQLDDTGNENEIIFSWEVMKASSFPEWFLNRFRQGDLPSVFMDMVIHNLYFPPPQVEDYDYPSSHVISIPIIGVIYGLLVDGENAKPLKCQIRKHRSPNHYIEVTPVFESKSTKFSLLDVPKLPVDQRLSILVETAGVNVIDQKRIASLPESWQLYLMALLFWARQTKEPLVNNSHISALLLCLILLDVVSKNAICLGSTKKSRRKQKNNLKRLRSNDRDNVLFTCALSVGNIATAEDLPSTVKSDIPVNNEEASVKRGIEQNVCGEENVSVEEEPKSANCVVEALENVSSEECGFAKKILRPFCLMEEKLKTRSKLFNVSIVHTFSQFQSCLLHFSYLNTLLGYPLAPCVSFRVFSGTFVYNMYNNLKQRTDSLEYISRLLSTAPSVFTLFKFLRQEVDCMVPYIPSTDHLKKKPRKKKMHCRIEKTENTSNECQEISDDTEFEDPCNRFSALTVKH